MRDPLIIVSVIAGIGLFMGLAALVLAAEHQADIPLLRDEVDRLRSALDRAGVPIPGPVAALEPITTPIPVPVHPQNGTAPLRGSWRTDTAAAEAVAGATASRILDAERYGRHAATHRAPRGTR